MPDSFNNSRQESSTFFKYFYERKLECILFYIVKYLFKFISSKYKCNKFFVYNTISSKTGINFKLVIKCFCLRSITTSNLK